MCPVSNDWLKESDYESHTEFLWELVRLLEVEAGPWASEIRALRLNNDALGLAGLSIDHRLGGDPGHLIAARQCRALFEKFESLKSNIDREQVAWEKFQQSERECFETNMRFRDMMRLGGKQPPPSVAGILHAARRKIHQCLGKPPLLEEIPFAFGPGANTSVKARASSARWKLHSPLTCSSELAPTVSRWLHEVPAWVEAHRTHVDPLKGQPLPTEDNPCMEGPVTKNHWNLSDEELLEAGWSQDDLDDLVNEEEWASMGSRPTWKSGAVIPKCDQTKAMLSRLEDSVDSVTVDLHVHPGKLQFVPKNYKTHRAIIVEPLLNSTFQKGVGTLLRERLGRIGQNLRDQSRNQRLAREGSITGRLATVDLSSASDTISKELVYFLLEDPMGNYEWVTLLRQLRTSEVVYKGNPITLQKWSSMGNGYTFELESLIFWALTSACVDHVRASQSQVSIYGDDIICPVEAVPILFEVFSFCGFTVNSDKSFWDGPFRESCGADYLLGFDIRPFYMKKLISGQSLFALHNFFVRDLRPDLAAVVLKQIPEDLRLWGPDGYGDGHLIGSWIARRPKGLRSKGFCGGIFDTFTLTKRLNKKELPIGDRVLPVYSIYAQGGSHWLDGDVEPSDHFVVRGHKGYQRVSIYTMAREVFPKPRK